MSLLRKPPTLSRLEFPLSVLLGFVTLASILPILLLGVYGLSQYVTAERTDRINRLTRYTEALAKAVDRELKGYADTAEVLAASRHLLEGDLEAFGELARDAAGKANGHFVLIDRSNRQLVNTRSPTDVDLPVLEDVQGLKEVFDTASTRVSDLFFSPVSKGFAYFVSAPVKVEGKVRYALGFKPSASATYSILQQSFLPEGWNAAVIDGNGRIVARSFGHGQFFGKHAAPELLERLVEPPGTAAITRIDGRDVVVGHQRSGLNDWQVAVWAPESLLNAEVDQVLVLVIGLAVLTLLASFGAAYLAGRIIAEPARRLLNGAQSLGAGEPVRFEATHMREANIVGSALAEAAKNIAAREKALRMSELHTRYIMRELAHRSKNLLAVVQAIARQTGRAARDVKEFNLQLGERLAALGRSQDLLVQKKWQGVALEDLAAAQLKPFIAEGGQRIAMQGPPVLLSSDAAQNIGMALYELATNASKHGAFSAPSGRVDISWDWLPAADGERRLELCWRESGGPEVKPPTHKGFGHTVIEQLAAASLRGTARLDWQPHGLVWTLEVPECALAGRREELGDEVEAAGSTDLLNTGPGGTDNLGRS